MRTVRTRNPRSDVPDLSALVARLAALEARVLAIESAPVVARAVRIAAAERAVAAAERAADATRATERDARRAERLAAWRAYTDDRLVLGRNAACIAGDVLNDYHAWCRGRALDWRLVMDDAEVAAAAAELAGVVSGPVVNRVGVEQDGWHGVAPAPAGVSGDEARRAADAAEARQRAADELRERQYRSEKELAQQRSEYERERAMARRALARSVAG